MLGSLIYLYYDISVQETSELLTLSSTRLQLLRYTVYMSVVGAESVLEAYIVVNVIGQAALWSSFLYPCKEGALLGEDEFLNTIDDVLFYAWPFSVGKP